MPTAHQPAISPMRMMAAFTRKGSSTWRFCDAAGRVTCCVTFRPFRVTHYLRNPLRCKLPGNASLRRGTPRGAGTPLTPGPPGLRRPGTHLPVRYGLGHAAADLMPPRSRQGGPICPSLWASPTRDRDSTGSRQQPWPGPGRQPLTENVIQATLGAATDALRPRTGYHAGIRRPGEWPAGEKIECPLPVAQLRKSRWTAAPA